MTELGVALAVIAALIAVIAALVAASLVGKLWRRGSPAIPAEHSTPRTSGALVPIAPPRPLPDLSKVSLERLPEPLSAQAELVIVFTERLSSELQLARANGKLDSFKGPAASALASLLGNEQIVNTLEPPWVSWRL